MLKKVLSIFLISRWLIAIFVIAVVGVAVTPIEKETRTIKGTIINKNIGLVTVGSNEHPGQILTLSTDPKTELMAFQTGDLIIIEYSTDYIIQLISKQS